MLERKLRMCKFAAPLMGTRYWPYFDSLILSFLDEIEADLVVVSQRRQGDTSADTIDYIATFWTVARALRVIVYARMHSPATVSLKNTLVLQHANT